MGFCREARQARAIAVNHIDAGVLWWLRNREEEVLTEVVPDHLGGIWDSEVAKAACRKVEHPHPSVAAVPDCEIPLVWRQDVVTDAPAHARDRATLRVEDVGAGLRDASAWREAL